jgi:hypothetical protein
MAGTGSANVFGTAISFNLNSAFQPNTGGHQPYGFDTIKTMYDRYKVHRCDLLATFCYTGSVQFSHVGGVVLPPSASATIAGSTVEVVCEKPMSVCQPVVGGTGNGTATFTMSFDIAKWCGLTVAEFKANTEDYAAQVTASPSRLLRVEWAVADFSTTTASSLKVRFDLVYHVEFFDRIILTQS